MVQCICILPESRPTEGWRLESFLVALGVVFPMLGMMASGVILRKTGMADRPLVRRVDAINFHLFLPCLLFYNIYNVDLAQDFSVEVLVFAAAGLVLSLALSLLIVPRLVHRRDQVGVVVQAIVRSNFVMFGLAVTEYIYGAGTATNPLIIASALALVLLFLDVRLPAMVVDVVATMSRVATPLAFTMLGATLSLEGLHRNRRVLVWTCLARMVLLPAVALTAAVALGFREVELTALMVFFAAPTAVSSFTMAQQMGSDGELAAQLVALTSGLSLGTIFLITFLFRSMGLL